ncbi:MAG TPA: phosphate ABC transporter substrate-binding protein PstS [Steroidobacteraceae bacterium]|nr:phosphate ABC transporter substrate-binding protein PstS [Steroidobacteraceae bacterium]
MDSKICGFVIRTAAILAAGACGQAAFAGQEIHGAGATFPAPVYAAWSAEYQRSTGVRLTFDAVGSGEGIERIRRRQVDFGASDAALTPEDLAASGLLQFAVVIGGVVPVINIRGIKPGQLKLSGSVLADIYQGRIRKWNDVSIRALNPTLALPNVNITVVHRSDPSGTTLLWTDYLSRSSAGSRDVGLGAALAPRWPIGVGGKGNEGVATFVQRTRFAIGYVEYIYAKNHHLSDVALRNRSGTFVHAGRDAFTAAAMAAIGSGVNPMQQLATDLPGTESWPITGASFILIPRSSENSGATRGVLRFFDWALHHGEAIALDMEYASLPKLWIEQLPALWRTVHDSTGQSVWP